MKNLNLIRLIPIRLLHLIVITVFAAPFASASILWEGNFETGDISQWNTPINPAGLSTGSDCVFDGKFAGKVRLTGDESFLWNGNKSLNRSEFHHRNTPGHTYEGKDTFFAFSFYLPTAFTNHKHELGYWESDKSWRQLFRFNITGTELSFQETAAKNAFWKLQEGATPGQWHRIALHIYWSTDPKTGSVETWVNGEHMGKHQFRTLPAKDALMFTQIGILRTQEKSVEEIYIDGALETDNLTELLERNKHLVGKTCAIAPPTN